MMPSYQCRVLFLALFTSFVVLQTFAQDVINFKGGSDAQSIGKNVWFFEDKSGVLTLEDIQTPAIREKFVQSKTDALNFGNTRSAIWFRFAVNNTTDEECVLEIKKTLIHQIEFYKPLGEGSFEKIVTGSIHPLSSRPIRDNYFLFRLQPPRSGAEMFFMRFKSEESLEIPLSLTSTTSLFYEHKAEEIAFGLFYGLMIVMLIYNLFIYLSVKEKSYFYYVLFLLSVMMLNDLMISGLGFEYFWPQLPELNFYVNAMTAVVCISIILFSTTFLNTKVNTPVYHKILVRFFYPLSLGIIILNVGGEYFISSIACQAEIFLLSVVLIAMAIAALRKKVIIARYYLLAWSFLFIAALVYVFFMNGLLPSSKWTENAPLIGTTLEVIFLSFALADRIKLLRKEKEKAQLDKISFMREQNVLLERLVAERTHEIVERNDELIRHQAQIEEQNDSLQQHNLKLEEAQQIIESQNTDLKKYSEGLEHEVEKRAIDLVKSNRELVEQNQQLEQFAFIASHNLRAPVARIQGLANIIDHSVKNPDEQEQKFILKKIVESSRELDNVIYDLSRVLEVRKSGKQGYTVINIEEKILRVLTLLQDEIKESDIKIAMNLKAREFFTVPQYFESIVYNLISNAIKYRKAEITAELFIDAWTNADGLHLEVKDNGIGFNLELFKGKLFGLYQRFHTHVDGKGVGLHLVKTQVDSLDGSIEVVSSPDQGASFSMVFPFRT
jgi:signal transduction histidine kinase